MEERDSEDVQGALTPKYRGGKVVEVAKPLYVKSAQELYIDPTNVIDAVYLDHLKKGKVKANIKDVKDSKKGEKVITVTQMKNLRLDQILNSNQPSEAISDIGIDNTGLRVVPVVRFGRTYYSKLDFAKDFSKSYLGTLNIFRESEIDMDEFREAMEKTGLTPDELNGATKDPERKKKFLAAHCAYLFDSTGKIAPTTKSVLDQSEKGLNLSFFADVSITRFRKKESQWKIQGFFYVVEDDNGDQILYYADPFSKYGSTILLSTGKKRDEIISGLERELDLDREEVYLKRKGQKTDVSKLVEGPSGRNYQINMTRTSNSPLVHVPLLNISSSGNETAVVSIGAINPATKRQSNSLVITKNKIEQNVT